MLGIPHAQQVPKGLAETLRALQEEEEEEERKAEAEREALRA